MIKIAIVEDDKEQADLLTQYLNKYGDENECSFEIKHFDRAEKFLENCNGNFEIVFMDIELPDGNGMDVVQKMRETDKTTLVIFVTNLAQYAVKGYKVRAFDFIVKPISYYNFSLNFPSALECLQANKDMEIWIKTKEGKVRLFASRIVYIEVMKHYLTYHTKDGNFTVLGSIDNVADELKGSSFSFCNRCYLVNLKYVTQVVQMQTMVDGEWLQISRRKRTDFLKDLNDYLAGGN